MGAGLRLGRILGVEIRLDWSWFAIFLIVTWNLAVGLFAEAPLIRGVFSWALGAIGSLLLFGSVLVHELAHALMARRYGIEVQGITLFLFGGVAQIKGDPESPRQEVFIAGVGPVVSIILALACLGMAWSIPREIGYRPWVLLLGYVGVMNLALAAFNLVPGFPLDGGRMLRAGIWHFTGDLRKATRWASLAGRFFAWMLIWYGLYMVAWQRALGGLWLVLVGWFLHTAAHAAYQQFVLRKLLDGVAVAEVMAHDVPAVEAEMTLPEFVDNYMLRYDHSVYPVLRGGTLVGVIATDDVRELKRERWGSTRVGDLAQAPDQERLVRDDQDAWEALTQMVETDANRLLVMHDGKLEGVVSREAIMQRAEARTRRRQAA